MHLTRSLPPRFALTGSILISLAVIPYVIYSWKGLWPLFHVMHLPRSYPRFAPPRGSFLKIYPRPLMRDIVGKICDHLFILCSFFAPPPNLPSSSLAAPHGEGIFINLNRDVTCDICLESPIITY